MSYQINNVSNAFQNFVKPAEILKPATTLVVADARHSQHCFLANNSTEMNPNTILTTVPLFNPISPHRKQNNFLFLDGHVQRRDVRTTWGAGSANNPLGMWTFNPDD